MDGRGGLYLMLMNHFAINKGWIEEFPDPRIFKADCNY